MRLDPGSLQPKTSIPAISGLFGLPLLVALKPPISKSIFPLPRSSTQPGLYASVSDPARCTRCRAGNVPLALLGNWVQSLVEDRRGFSHRVAHPFWN